MLVRVLGRWKTDGNRIYIRTKHDTIVANRKTILSKVYLLIVIFTIFIKISIFKRLSKKMTKKKNLLHYAKLLLFFCIFSTRDCTQRLTTRTVRSINTRKKCKIPKKKKTSREKNSFGNSSASTERGVGIPRKPKITKLLPVIFLLFFFSPPNYYENYIKNRIQKRKKHRN